MMKYVLFNEDLYNKDNGVIIKIKYEQLSNCRDIIELAINDMDNPRLSLNGNK